MWVRSEITLKITLILDFHYNTKVRMQYRFNTFKGKNGGHPQKMSLPFTYIENK